MKTTIRPVMLGLALLVAGCLESNPQPMPEQDTFVRPPEGSDAGEEPAVAKSVDEDLIFSSAPDESGQMVVVGAEGAAQGADSAYAGGGEEGEEPGADGDENGASVAGDGSFVIVIPKIKPPKLTLTFHYPDTDETVVVDLTIPDPASDSDARPWMDAGAEKQGDPGFNQPPAEYDGIAGGESGGVTVLVAGDGIVDVIGTPFSVTPLATVVAANLTGGDKVLTQANTVGEFSIQVAGVPGDLISVFVVNPADHTEATAALVLPVPSN